MNLHTINKTSQHTALYQNMLSAVSSEDTILLIEDGVYSALEAHSKLFHSLSSDIEVLALEADVNARGLTDKLSKRVQIVNDDKFVELSCQNGKVISWY
jgi:tRNA 2-thiouridine synthesizing protein B